MFKLWSIGTIITWFILALMDVGTVTQCSGKPIIWYFPLFIGGVAGFLVWLGYMWRWEENK